MSDVAPIQAGAPGSSGEPGAPGAFGPASRPALRGPFGWIDDRLNPILVREVRQSLSGRYFRYTFWLTLVSATVIGIVVLASAAEQMQRGRVVDEVGIWFFTAIFACLATGVMLFVPFSAFMALGSEWEENTYDLLVLSNLRPRQIVLGKLLATQVQALMFYSAFGPFVVFAFVMRGVDLVAALFAVGAVALFSLFLTLVALVVSGLARARFARIAMMAALTVALVYATAGGATFGYFVIEEPHELRDPGFWQGCGALATGLVLACGLLFVWAAGKLAHPEENRSTGPRILTTVIPLAALPWAVWLYAQWGDEDVPIAIVVTVLFVLILSAAGFATEPERLGRRVRRQVPRSRLGAFLSAPFLPGGGRGLLLFASLLVLIVAAFGALFLVMPARTTPMGTPASGLDGTWPAVRAMLILCAYAFVYVALPSGLFGFLPWVGRRTVAISIPLFAVLAFAVPTILTWFVGENPGRSDGTAHLGNPFWLVEDVLNGRSSTTGPQLLLAAVVAFAVVLNLPRLIRGVGEVLSLSAERRTAESEGPADAVPES